MNKKAKAFLILLSIVVVVILLSVSIAIARPNRARKACNDNIDNDGDSYIDHPSDPGCANKNDNSELDPNVECDDGLDNDGDGNIDYNDTGCSGPTDNDETDCGDGVCEGGETYVTCPADCPIPDSCNDTDGGNFPLIFGTTSGYLNETSYSNDDYCVDSSNIMEYYCSGDYEQSQQQSCGTDGYGDNYCSSGDVYRDYIDYFCSSGACDSNSTPELVEECDYGCTNGTCDPIPDSCSDTDGGFNIWVKGNVSGYSGGSPYNYSDSCNGTTMLIEQYCSGDSPSNSNYDCNWNSTTCSNGACV